MAVRVRIPTSMQQITKGEIEVEASANNIKELVENLDKQYTGIKERIYGEGGQIYKFINIYVNKENIRVLQQDDTPLSEGDEVDIVVAVPGG